MAREPLVIGPFAGGLNTYDDATAIKDTELVECTNWDPGLEGSLRSRPPFHSEDAPLTLGASGDARLLGFYYTGTTTYLFASDGLSSTWAYNGSSWSLVTDTFAATAMVQFDNKAWMSSPVGESSPGGYWTSSGGFTADADMPHGDTIVAHKSRLWTSSGKGNPEGTRVYYSKVLGQPDFWDSPAFIDIGQGDGQDIVRLTTYYNTLVAFRTQSVYSFAFNSDPAQGNISLLVPGVGLASRDCLIEHENYLYFMYDEKAYQFVNNNAQQINIKVPFTASSQAGIAYPFAVSLFNNRAIFHYYDTMYVYSLRTRTWTKWRSTEHTAIGQIMSPAGVLTDEAYALPSVEVATGGSRECDLLKIEDRITAATESFSCEIRTKNYSYQLSSNFKRLFWWGVDATFRDRVQGWAIPIVHHMQVTWNQLYSDGVTWGQLLAGTWGSPYIGDLSLNTDYDLGGTGPIRKFVKMFKSMRFRQIQFRVVFDTDGGIGTAPVNLFTLTAYVETKETVSKSVS
jgi:hypothetical protein|tara:strand:- start:6620 stop:8155 length:1536 start_codon:yes stop_codon:yes gene_type:complete